MIEQLLRIDEKLFFAINTGWGSPLSDGVMTLASEAGSAGVLFIFGIFYILLWEKEKRRARLITFILTMGVAGALLLIAKDYFNRDRPLKHFETEIAKSEVFIRAPTTISSTKGHFPLAIPRRRFRRLHFLPFTIGVIVCSCSQQRRWLRYQESFWECITPLILLLAHLPGRL